MGVFQQIVVTVTIDTAAHTFTAATLDESMSASSFAGALAAISTRLQHLHDELQDVSDADLSEEGKSIRDTPFTF